ncbi:thioredoxin family protein [bacterium]|nr:thioredoxin family protein [bacterium]
MKKIEILGVGCPTCKKAEEAVRKKALDMGMQEGTDFVIEKIQNPSEIAAKGVFMTPGIVVDGTVVRSGGVPKPNQIEEWLK